MTTTAGRLEQADIYFCCCGKCGWRVRVETAMPGKHLRADGWTRTKLINWRCPGCTQAATDATAAARAARPKAKRGFACLSPERVREISAMGGRKNRRDVTRAE